MSSDTQTKCPIYPGHIGIHEQGGKFLVHRVLTVADQLCDEVGRTLFFNTAEDALSASRDILATAPSCWDINDKRWVGVFEAKEPQ